MNYLEKLKEMSAHDSPSGDEKPLGLWLKNEGESFVDEAYFDTLGSLILHKKGSGKKIMLAAHMDSIGLVVTHIEDKGYLRVGKLGGIDIHSLLHSKFRLKNGQIGVLTMGDSTPVKDMKLTDLYLDIGASSKEEAEKIVSIGDSAVSLMSYHQMGNKLTGPYMDNRISCLVLLDVLSKIKSDNDIYFVFTSQEEVGLRGAKTATFAIEPDLAFAVDVTSGDELDSKPLGYCNLGNGTAIKVMDNSLICDKTVVEMLSKCAKTHEIMHQKEVITVGGTDAGVMQKTKLGILTGALSIPCRYIHTPIETVDLDDIEATSKLLCAFLAE